MIDRRDFLKAGALASAGEMVGLNDASGQEVRLGSLAIQSEVADSIKTRLAARELQTGLQMLHPALNIIQAGNNAASSGITLTLAIDVRRFENNEEYEISASASGATLRAASEQALLFAVFGFLEKQGLVFGIDGTTAPIDNPAALRLPGPGQPWASSPTFAVRGLLPWPDFLNCISVFNEEDFKAYFAAMLRMRFNIFGMHVYTENQPGPSAESYLSFDYAGSGHRAVLEDSTGISWGYLPQRTSTFKMGAAQFFDGETFGADAMRLAADNWEIAARTTELLRRAFKFAGELGIRTGIGFEPYKNPTEIVRALPPEALKHPGGFIESNTARDLLKRRLADLLERYPDVNYVWLWQDEGANWESRKKSVPLSATPFSHAHNFLKRHAPDKRLVLAGWGGVARHFESLHQRLPEDIVFSALSDSLGWDPVHESFGKLGSRERWPIPWIEDDPSMWFPQFRASRFEKDIRRADELGCQGVMGIHWRNRVIDPTATYFARAMWDSQLRAREHYRSFSAALASEERVGELAALLDDCDRSHGISATFLGEYDSSGFAKRQDLTGDYDEAFNYATTEPDLAILDIQRKTAERFRDLAARASSPLEQNRIGYFANYVGLMVPYCDCLESAHKLDAVLKNAVELRTKGKEDDARKEALEKGVPLWLAIAPRVREVMLDFQALAATRNDLGQLVSMQNKLVRIALERLRLSIKEFLVVLPPEMDKAYAEAISAEGANPSRLFIPTRPSLLKPGEILRIFINALGQEENLNIQLMTRRQGTQTWNAQDAAHAGRNVYSAKLGPFQAADGAIEYYASASGKSSTHTDPPQAPTKYYILNVFA